MPLFAGWRTVTDWDNSSIVMFTVAVRSSYVVLALQRIETVTGASEGSPDDGDTVTQESELLTLQALFAVKVIEPLLPSALNSMLEGLVMVSSGAFWQEMSPTDMQIIVK